LSFRAARNKAESHTKVSPEKGIAKDRMGDFAGADCMPPRLAQDRPTAIGRSTMSGTGLTEQILFCKHLFTRSSPSASHAKAQRHKEEAKKQLRFAPFFASLRDKKPHFLST
jgi:hypothetical protein